MKPLLIVMAILFIGCGKKDSPTPVASVPACTSTANGSWTDEDIADDILVLNADCSGTGSYCAAKFTYTSPASSGVTVVSVSETNGNTGCLPVGKTNCTFVVSGNSLTYDCGLGTIHFSK